MSKPFPPPPFSGNRSPAAQQAATDCPFDKPAEEEFDPHLSDEGTLALLKQYLRPDQLQNKPLLKFILSYVTTRNAGDAAVAAGWKRATGQYWRARPEVHAVIEAITATAVMKYGYDATEVIERVKEISGFDPVVFENPDGSYKNRLSDIPADSRRAIKKLKVKNLYGQDANGMQIVMGQIIDIEVWDKLKAHELLGREKNIMKQTTVMQHDVTSNMASLLLESGKRAEDRKALMGRVVSEEGNVEGSDNRAGGRDDGGISVAESGSEVGEEGPGNDIEIVPGEEDLSERDEGPL